MKILVTGASGFIGSNLCKRLSDDKHNVIALGAEGENNPICNQFIKKPLNKIDWSAFDNIDVVFHEAANNDTLDTNEEAMMQANYYSPVRMFHELELYGCKRFIYASSTAIFGNAPAPYREDVTPIQPLNAYGRSKAKFDEFAMHFAFMTKSIVVGLRYCNVFGPGEGHKGKRASMISQLLLQMKANKQPRIFKNGEQRRDWIYVKDVVETNIHAMLTSRSGVFNCGSGKDYSFNEVVQIINKVLGKELAPEYIENPHPETYQNHTCCDISKLGFVPQYDLQSALKDWISTS
jgi:ADP-L-glycero-D-manno-heptose 6-epimerase